MSVFLTRLFLKNYFCAQKLCYWNNYKPDSTSRLPHIWSYKLFNIEIGSLSLKDLVTLLLNMIWAWKKTINSKRYQLHLSNIKTLLTTTRTIWPGFPKVQSTKPFCASVHLSMAVQRQLRMTSNIDVSTLDSQLSTVPRTFTLLWT